MINFPRRQATSKAAASTSRTTSMTFQASHQGGCASGPGRTGTPIIVTNRTIQQQFACVIGSPAQARRFCASSLGRTLGGTSQALDLIDDAKMIVSELITNAINAHCRGAELTLIVNDDVVRIEVQDDAPGTPRRQVAAPDDERGRGLNIVAALSRDWGFEQSPGGKRVWAELTVA
jgi:anti-sigma regulatory factor (Ser/Thr protein kinase)